MSVQPVAVQPAQIAVRRLAASWHLAALTGILGLATFLDFFRLSQNGYANTYYAGAVRSMTQSWHNFFFASFDPGGLVSVDKPPVALWAEAASAKLFGFSGFTILLPEALVGIAAVWILYLLVTRPFGRTAGLLAALALAVSPVSVAVNRDSNPDAVFVLLLVAAAYVGLRAIESGRLRTLLATAVLVGLAFNTKMLEAGLVVPGIALAYVLFAKVPWRRRLGYSALAGAVLVAVSGAWIAVVDLTPAADRPYVGSTSDNSALSLALGYNGLGRVTGQEGGTSFGGGAGGGGAFSGTPGVLRLLNDALGDQGAWLLPLAIVGGASVLLAAISGRRRRDLAALTVIGGWFVAAAVVFSLSSGIIHTYYLSALAPATAALVGAGAVALWRDAARGGARAALPITALALSGWLELVLLRRSGYLSWLQVLVVIGTVAAITVAAGLAPSAAWGPRWRLRAATAAAGVGIAALLVAPLAWSATTFKSPVNGVFPGAGPSFVSGLSTGAGGFGRGRGGPGGFGLGSGSSSGVDAALAYAEAHGAAARFGLIVSSEREAADAVIRGESVASMGGFTGRETVLTSSYLASLLRSGDARYFLLGSGGFRAGPGGTANAAADLIASACTPVSSSAWAGSSSSGNTLYDCAGKAEAVARAG